MNDPNWADVLTAFSTALVPLLVVIIGVVLAIRQTRNQELVKARLEYYKSLAPGLNRLMCYMTFIGTWRDDSPDDIVALKRELDNKFFRAAPLFSPRVSAAYNNLMELSFSTFGYWGADALIASSAYRRRQAWRNGKWKSRWNSAFSVRDEETLSAQMLSTYRAAYDSLLSFLVEDMSLNRSRPGYTTPQVSLNAQAPHPRPVEGKPS
jgi:hypothetical protein